MPISENAALPPGQLAVLLDEADEALERARRAKDRLDGALDLKYGARAASARASDIKATGTVRFADREFIIVADLPKRVKWDQTRLAEAAEIIRRDLNDDPGEYLRTELKVSETAYGSWPPAIRRLFEPARTVETGKPTYRIEQVEREAVVMAIDIASILKSTTALAAPRILIHGVAASARRRSPPRRRNQFSSRPRTASARWRGRTSRSPGPSTRS